MSEGWRAELEAATTPFQCAVIIKRLADALEKIDTIPWDSQASAQMRTYAHFALYPDE